MSFKILLFARRLAIAFTSLAFIVAATARAEDGSAWKARIESAKAGDVIALPAGELSLGNVSIPPGVAVQGAGYHKTIIHAAEFPHGFLIRDGEGSKLSDLTVRQARESGVLVSQASGVRLSRLALVGNLTGLLIDHVREARIENLIVANNRTGASLADCADTALVNCSFVDNTALTLAVSGADRVAIFNNLFVNCPTGVYLSANNKQLALDYNLYVVNFIGRFEGEVTRSTLPGWQRISEQDAHSVVMPVDFADPAKGDYHPVRPQSWAPTRATTSDWGTRELLGFAAPTSDIDGVEQSNDVDLGAHAVSLATTRQPDGTFTIESADGVKSAGLYTSEGVRVATFFQNQPLRPGKHAFWLPSRDDQNRPLPPGNYEVRVVESQLTNPYLGLAGNFATSSNRLDNCSWAEEMFAFDKQDRIYIAQNAFENGMGVRAFDKNYAKPRWMMPGGGQTVGVATDDAWFYYLQRVPGGKYNLRKIDLETGEMGQIASDSASRIFAEPFSADVFGMTLLDGKLYVADAGKGKVFYSAVDNPTFSAAFDVPQARSVTADSQSHVLWVICAGGALVAIDPATGAQKANATPVDGATVIAANQGRLAVLSRVTGKIHLLDCADPAKLAALRTIGVGDGPGGPQQPDRFWFQNGRKPNTSKTHVAINSQGEVAVIDDCRVSFWANDGTLKKQGLGYWGQHNTIGKLAGDDDLRVWNISGEYSIRMDSRQRRWVPDRRWELPAYQYDHRSPRAYFTTGGKNFGVYSVAVGDPGKTPDGKLRLENLEPAQLAHGLLVVRLDDKLAVPVSLYYPDSAKQTLVELHDNNGDGLVDGNDQAQELRLPDGSAARIPADRYGGIARLNGDLVFTNPTGAATGSIIAMSGLDPTGNFPVYAWTQPRSIPCRADQDATFLSPYDFKTQESANRSVQLAELSDGGYASSVGLRSSGGTGLANGAGTDLAGFSKEGRLRWIFKLNYVQGSEGVQSIPEHKLVMGMTSTQCDYMVVDEDGLGLGVLAMPKESHWGGMWSDHAQQQWAWTGNDGQPYYLLGDYSVNGMHWFAIAGMEKTRRHAVPVKIDEVRAAALAQLPPLTPETSVAIPPATVIVRRLQAPLPIDGDLRKWSAIPPAAIVTPDTGSADITGPQDCSAVIRLAYHGSDLYLQTVVFDNRVTFHQPQSNMYQADGIEMAINSFMSGFKYNVAVTTDMGPTVYRNKFAVKHADRIYPPDQAPRTIKVLDSAANVEERKLIEAIYGVDLRASQVIITELKLPLTAQVAFDGEPSVLAEVGPGKSFWIGFMINDNDIPGGDVQKNLVCPATHGTFNVKESGMRAVFE